MSRLVRGSRLDRDDPKGAAAEAERRKPSRPAPARCERCSAPMYGLEVEESLTELKAYKRISGRTDRTI